MRTTLSIDDDVLLAARNLAERQQLSLGEVVSALARQGLSRPRRAAAVRNGVPLLSSGAASVAVTMKLVNELRDELA